MAIFVQGVRMSWHYKQDLISCDWTLLHLAQWAAHFHRTKAQRVHFLASLMWEARNEALEMHKAIFAHKIHSYCDLSLNISVVNDWVLKMIKVGWVGGCGAKFCHRRYGRRPESLDQRFITHNFFVAGFSSMNLPPLGVNTGKALVHAEDSARSNAFPSQHRIEQSACSDCFHWWSSLFPSPFSQDVALDPWIACTKYGYARCLCDSPCSLEDGAPSNRMSVQFNSQPRARMCEIYSIMVFSSAFGMAWLLNLPSSTRLFPPLSRSRKVLLGIPKWAAACRWDICFLITAMMASWIFSTGCLTRLFFGAASAFSSVYSGGSILTSTLPWHSWWRQVTWITISI